MVIKLSFNLLKEGVLGVYFVRVWNKDIDINLAKLLIIAEKLEANCANMFKWF